jgi:hypothetical protein
MGAAMMDFDADGYSDLLMGGFRHSSTTNTSAFHVYYGRPRVWR